MRGLKETYTYLRSFKDCEMKFFLNMIVITVFSGTLALGQNTSKMDPLSIQFDQMKASITNIIDMVNQQSEIIKNLEIGDGAQVSIDGLKADLSAAKVKLDEFNGSFSNLRGSVSTLEDRAEKMSKEQVALEDRISSLEKIILEIPTPLPGRVILGEDGKAKLFSLDGLEGFKSQLPPAEKCAEFGAVLVDDAPIRNKNAFFAKNSENEITICKLLFGEFQELYSAKSEEAHVVVLSE